MTRRLFGLLALGCALGIMGCHHVAGICDCGNGMGPCGARCAQPAVIVPAPVSMPAPAPAPAPMLKPAPMVQLDKPMPSAE